MRLPNIRLSVCPFVRLANDGIWELTTDDGTSASEHVGALRSSGATGRLTPDFEMVVLADPALCAMVARLLLDREWEESLHSEICRAVGLDIEGWEVAAGQVRALSLAPERRRRDPAFRRSVLTAYEYQCAMCGYDGWLDGEAQRA